ncbi:MAG: Gfo/Idh/MocA family protein [Limisphaerales bacterium]
MDINNSANRRPVRVALAGLGKMGLSHLAILNMQPKLQLVGVCDSATYMLDIISKYGGIVGYTDYRTMLERAEPEAVVIATPSALHEQMVAEALRRNIHVFCEKPFCLDVKAGAELVLEAERRGLVNQVGYHNRFVGTFEEARKLISAGVIGEVYHATAECYGPVVLKPKGSTWRANKSAGGGCLYDYACHGIDLIHFMIGQPDSVSGSTLGKIFSTDAEDEVYANLRYPDGKTAQISANWSDDSYRKMHTTISLWGTKGKIIAGRQEISLFIKERVAGYQPGWTKIYTTSITSPVGYYLRGEEYSAQIDHFADCITEPGLLNKSDFRSAHATDVVADWIRQDAELTEDRSRPQSQHVNRTGTLQAFKRSFSSLGAGSRVASR